MQLENVLPDITEEISDAGKKLPDIGKVPHDDNEASRDIEKSLAHVIDVLMHVDSATRELGGNPFELLFFLPDMREEKNDVLFPLPEKHPPAILLTFCAFVLKRRAAVRTSAGFVHEDVPIVLSGAVEVEKVAERDDNGRRRCRKPSLSRG